MNIMNTMNITEDYVSFEVAKLLKEKRFDKKCDYCYAFFDEDDIRVLELKPSVSGLSLMENRYPYITQSAAMKWLREVHHIHILPEISDPSEVNPKYYIVIWTTGPKRESYILELFDSYEEAVEEGIKYCLENLV